MKKYLLLTAAAATALVAAGPAAAGVLSAISGPGATVNATPTVPYRLARELNFGAGVPAAAGQFDLIYTFLDGIQQLTPGSYDVTITYSGATITAPLTTTPKTSSVTIAAANRTAADGPAGIHEQTQLGGGAPVLETTLTVKSQTANEVVLELFIPEGKTVRSIFLNPALLVTGNVEITAKTINRVTNQPVDNSVISTLVTTNNQGFVAGIDRGVVAAPLAANVWFGDGAQADTRIHEGASPAFARLRGDGAVASAQIIGEVIVAVSGNAVFNTLAAVPAATPSQPVFKDLNGTLISLNDVVSTTVAVNGNLAGLATNPASTSTPTASGASIQYAGAGTANAAANVGVPGDGANAVAGFPAGVVGTTVVRLDTVAPVTTTSPQLNPTELPASVQLQLGAAFTSPAAFPGSFEDLQTDGFTYIVPWVASSNQAATTGNTTVIRVSNLATDYTTAGGRVYGQLYNPSNAAGVSNLGRSFNFGTLGQGRTGNRELVISSATLQDAFGDFGRGDLRLTVTTSAVADNNAVPGGGGGALGNSNIVVKRILQNANGSQTEINVLPGDASTNANDPNTSAPRY